MPVAAPQRVLLPDSDDQAQADLRLSYVQMLLDYKRDAERFGCLRLKDGTPVSSATRMSAYVAEVAGVSLRTIKYWLSRYQQGGLPISAKITIDD
jgi:hypothetical protein